ncbi:MAG TPA: PAS domain S-box protein [Chthonomonadaceae bacterium]|nr:PAS domain S-box protein [Chthonomonadaceae bacterium]
MCPEESAGESQSEANRGASPGKVGALEEVLRRFPEGEQEAQRPAARVTERLDRLQTLSLALPRALTVDQVVDVMLTEGLEALSANAGVVSLLSEDRNEIVTVRAIGVPQERLQAQERYPADAPTPIADALRTREPIFLQTQAERKARYPQMVQVGVLGSGSGAIVVLPLLDQSILGAIGLSFPTERAFDAEERQFMQTIARICGLALERAHLYDTERRAREQAQQEIRERQQAEEALRESQDRLRLMMESIRDYAIIMFDAAGNIIDWNPGAERILGYRAEEILGQHGSVLFTPEDREQHLPEREMEQATREGKSSDDRWHMRKDQSRLWVMGTMMAMRDAQGSLRGFVKIMRNMTERRQAEEERLRAYAKIAEQERQFAVLAERNRIAREIHDTLAQGLTGIMIQLEVAEELLTATPEQARSHLDLARKLAGESLEAARRSVQALRPHPLEGATLAEALARLAEAITGTTPVPVSFHLRGASRLLPYEVESNLLRIAQEALTNALRHARATQIQMELAYEPGQVQLRVRDNGVGFVAGTPTPGSTFGLVGMRERAQQSGGSLQINSQPERGTEVIATIPVPTAGEQGS